MDDARRAAREYKDIFEPGPLLPRDPVQRAAGAGEGQRQPASSSRATSDIAARRHRRRALRQARGRDGARAPDVHRLGQDAAPTASGCATAPTSCTSPAPRRCCRASRTCREAVAQHDAHRRDVQRRAEARQADAPDVPGPRGPHAGLVHGASWPRDGLDAALRGARALPRSTATRTAHRLEHGARRHLDDGVPRLLPHRPGLHQLGEGARHPGRPGPRLGRRPHRGVRAADHRPRSHPATTCCSSASSTPSACRCRTSTSTSARTGATRSSTTSPSKYGKDNVGQIITFGSLKAQERASGTSCRVFGLPFSEGDRIAKLVPEVLNITAEGRRSRCEPRLKEMIEQPTVLGTLEGGREVTAKDVLDHRHGARGAAPPGRACTPPAWSSPTSRCGSTSPSTSGPARARSSPSSPRTRSEAAGLVKFDFLGLKTLTVIQNALDLINRGTPARAADLRRDQIPARRPGDLRAHLAAATPPASSRWSRAASPRW